MRKSMSLMLVAFAVLFAPLAAEAKPYYGASRTTGMASASIAR